MLMKHLSWLFACFLLSFKFCVGWIDERPTFESVNGNLFLSTARDRNITLKTLGSGNININDINLLHTVWAAQNASHLVERWKSGILDDVESTLQRLSHIIEGPNGVLRKINAIEYSNESPLNISKIIKPTSETESGVGTITAAKVKSLSSRLRRLEIKVRTINVILRTNECASDPCQNGGTCIDSYDSFHCHCLPEWQGALCSADVNECERYKGTPSGCQNGATCINLPGSFSCTCPPGWHGFHCATQKSVCDESSNSELCGHGVCLKTNTPLGYTCICEAGWDHLGDTDPSCRKDVDECTGSRYPCSVNPLVTCHNVPGTFYCGTCPAGYTGDGFKCQDIDECLANNGGCSTAPMVECINTLGSRKCGLCPSGYQGDGVTCFYTGSCANNNGGCHRLATCREAPNSDVLCLCASGYEGNGKGPNGCKIVENACSSDPCVYGTCESQGTNEFICTCNPGYTGATCNRPLNPCVPNPCKNNGTCSQSNGRPVCECTGSFTGPTCARPKQSCGGYYVNPSGRIEFPITGNKYDNSLSCAWVIITNHSMVLNVTFTKFSLESAHGGDECKHDYVQIHDGRSAGSRIIGRYCGSELAQNGSFISTHNAIYIWFRSDKSVNEDGFAFTWTSVRPSCGGDVDAEYGSISSPGYPGKYPTDRDCYWNVRGEPGKRIAFHFISLAIEEHPTCDFDYVEINETNYIGEHRIGIFCNHSQPAPLTTTGSNAVVHFHSDSSGMDKGFHLSFLAVPGSPDCGGIFTSERGEIVSPGYSSGSYKPDMDCDWEIRLPEGSRVRINWLNFDVERSRNCMFDSVQIFEGPTTDSPLVGRYCGSTLPPPLSVKSNRVLVRFESDANLEEKGFTLKYEVECGGIFTEPSGILKSPFYPNYYPASKECVYLISQPPGKAVVLTFEFMDIEEGSVVHNKSDCYFDRLEIRDGDTENSTLINTLCGSMHSMPTDPLYSTHNFMFIKFFTDATIHNHGFKANYTTIDRECGGIIKKGPGTINLPGELVSWNNNNLNCLWTIRAPPNHAIQLTWINFPSATSIMPDECTRNYIELVEDYGSTDAKSLGKYCPNKAPPQIMTTQGNDLTLHYHSNGEFSDTTYQASYIFVNDTHNCGGHYFTPTGHIKSPNYPEKYPKNKDCVWIIEAESKYLVTLTFNDFHLENSSKCSYDYLEIRSGSRENSPLIGRFCGDRIEDEITSMTNQMYVKFVSDASLQKKGFEVQWNSMKTGCGGNLYTSNGAIISPNYPLNYYHRAACTWNIRVSAGSVIRITFTDFELEDHIKCAFDYLEISDVINGYSRDTHRFCGTNSPSLLISDSNQVKLYFRSDVMTNSRGFHLRYTTDCNHEVFGFQGVIESPNFPRNYDDLSRCLWTITVPAGNTVNITFSHFDVQASADGTCKRDYVNIQEGEDRQPNTDIVTKCGQEEDVLPLKISSTQRQVFVSFVSDRFGTATGFRLEWYVNGCSQYLRKPFGNFESPGYPDGRKLASAYVECLWLIEVEFDKSIEITFPKIDNTRNHACYSVDNNGSIEIYNGPDERSPRISHNLCYSNTPVTFTSTGNRMYIKYASETNFASHGFQAVYTSVPIRCGGRFTGQSGVIHSANYPKNYPRNQMCDWLITVDPSHAVNLTFIDLDLEKSKNCTDDYIKIYDGNSTNAPLLGTHCQSSESLPYYVSSGNQILVKMRTDSLVSAKGFMAHYNRTCGARITVDGYGLLRSSPTLHTMSSLNCSWILSAADPSDKVTLTFTHIDLESQDCLSNHIEVYEGEGIEGPMLGQLCNNKIPKPFYSSGNTLTVHITTVYGHIVGDKFDAVYSSYSDACGGRYTAEKGVIASPNHPSSYPNNADCIWAIRNSPGNRISLTFESFDLLDSENCDVDYLEIRENDGIGKLRGVFCGKNIQSITSSEPLWIRFKSGSNTLGNPNGFMAEYNLLFGNELSGDDGEIASPMYPMSYRKSDTFSWRVTVEFNFVIQLEFLDFHFDHYEDYCYSSLKIYDGFDDEAPLIKELCGISVPKNTITSSSNIIYVEMENNFDHVGNWFHLKWLKIPRSSNNAESEEIIKSNSSEIIILTETNGTHKIESPGFPNGYEDNLRVYWTIVSPIGTHLVVRFITLDLEESENCVADYVAIFKGYRKSVESEDNLLHKVCLSNSTVTTYAGSNVMTIEFSSDSFQNKTGFSAIVLTECGGIFEQSSGTIQFTNKLLSNSRPRPFVYSCEWVVKVRSGRKIKLNVVEYGIDTNQPKTTDNSCRSNYLMLKNGESSSSPLLGIGKYCNGVKPPVLNTTSNYLYVKLAIAFASANLKLIFRELGHDCGGKFQLSSKNDNMQVITSPNYPNIPTPHTECVWTFISVDANRLSIHFMDRFDLAISENCEKEYVEIRDGGTENSALLGKYCKNTPPSSLTTKGNILYVRYFTDLPEPRNGFKATITSGDVCGGIERNRKGGVISSPNYPEPYTTKSQQCSWWIIGPFSNRGIKIQFEDLMLPSAVNCTDTDHITIYEKIPGSFNNTEVGSYCGTRKPGVIDILTSEAVILFQSSFEKHQYGRGFKLNYTFNNYGCGGNLEGLSGEIKTNGYPRDVSYKYCNWKITVPIGFRVAVDIEDLDIGSNRYTMSNHVSFYHDSGSLAIIATLRDSSQSQSKRIESSSNFMNIYYISSGSHRGMKARFTALAPAACGGKISSLNGTLTNPLKAPFNETMYFCNWILRPPEWQGNSLETENQAPPGQTLAMTISGHLSNFKSMTNCQYQISNIMIKGTEIIAKVCGNITKPVVVITPYNPVKIEARNATSLVKVNFVINYKWYKCGGILSGLTHTIKPPKNITYPVYCSWKVKYPDIDDTILVSFENMNLGPCDKSYIHLKGKTYRSPSLGKFCGNVKPQNIVSPTNEMTIEFYAEEYTADFEIKLSVAEYECGRILRGKQNEIKSPRFPKSYTNNTECVWHIEANNGYHVGLYFVERFNLETSKDCQNDYVEVYEWKETVKNNSIADAHWKSLGRICGRVAPQKPFNSTNNKMMVKFVSNDKIEGEGFKAVWYSNCGGVYEVTREVNYIESPNFGGSYPSNIVCNYTLVAQEDQHIVVDFTNFIIEGNSLGCSFDNLTINTYHSGRWLRDSSTWCGTNSPRKKTSTGKMEIIFKTDNNYDREGFKFKYFINDCGGNITTPRRINPLILSDPDSYTFYSCVWVITAPPKKSVLVRFERFNITQNSRDCQSSALRVYEGNSTDFTDQQKTNSLKATFCGDLNDKLPVVQSLGNTMTINFYLHTFGTNDQALEASILFVNGPEMGCGGHVNVSALKRTEFKSQLSEFYEPLLDCHWIVEAPQGYSIEFTIDELDLRNTTFNNSIVNQHNLCNSDYLEIRDGGPYSQLIGHFCGPWKPSPIRSTGNLFWLRFVTDGTNEGRGIKGSFKALTSPCGIADLNLGNTTKTLQTPNYPEGYASDITCRWVIHGSANDKVRLVFKDFQLTDSDKCDTEYVQIADLNNREIISEGFGEQLIIGTSANKNRVYEVDYMPHTFYRYCGSAVPHDYYSNNKDVEIIFKGSSRGIADHKGFKLEYGKADCSHNYTTSQGRIVHKDITDCWVTIEVPQNYTISMYFNQFFLPGKYDCSLSNMQIWDGGFNNHSIETVCNYAIPNPVFSTGNRLSFHSFSSTEYVNNNYDITYTSTTNGRGCGGQFYNYAGVFTSPLYPNPYRNRSQCIWDIRVPKGMKVQLQFTVFDIGPKSMCETDYLTVTEDQTNGQEDVIMTYCGSDVPANYESQSDRVLITYTTSVNNGGSGWIIKFSAFQ